MPASGDVVLTLDGISKSFTSGTPVLRDVDLTLRRGQVHALVGENGAGKSTLCRIIAGATQPSAGQMTLDGQIVTFDRPRDALAVGIAMVYQETSLVPTLTVAQNLVLADGDRFVVTPRSVRRRASEVLERVGFDLPLSAPVSALSSAKRQLVEIARALCHDVSVLIFDEPTAALSPPETGTLFRLFEELGSQGVAILFISHALEEALRVADVITVLRDGERTLCDDAANLSKVDLVRSMVGRDVEYRRAPAKAATGQKVLLAVEDLHVTGGPQSMSFDLRAGEIVGMAGLVGCGRSEAARLIAGVTRRSRRHGGTVRMASGHPRRFRSARSAVRHGLCYVTEDRALEGMFPELSADEHVYVGWLATRRSVFASRKRARAIADEVLGDLDLRGGRRQPVSLLSGGNQQKVVLAKAMIQRPSVIILDEPTRGVDVGAIESIHRRIRALADEGCAVLLISSYLPEILALSDRILVVRDGVVVASMDSESATEHSIIEAATA